MKNLTKTLQTRFILLLAASLLASFAGSYVLIKLLFIKNGVDTMELDSAYVTLGIFLLCIIALSTYFYNRTLNKVNNDVKQIISYLHEISENKNYDASLKIDHYTDFLQISLLLKNVAKRLNQKDKKASKK